MADSLPALAPSRSCTSQPSAKKRDDGDDHSKAINSMCKSLTASVTKLLFSYQALQAETDGAVEAKSSIALALAASKREELSAKIVETLGAAVENVVRCKDVSMRSMVVRDIRARFAPPPEKPKPEMIDEAVQAVVRKPRVSLAAAAAAVMVAVPSPPVRTAPPEQASPSDDDILRQLRGDGSPPATATTAAGPAEPPPPTAAAAKNAAALEAIQNSGDAGSGARKPRPVSAGAAQAADAACGDGKPTLPGIYERQMQWAAKANERKAAARVEKENREREAGRPKENAKNGGRWAHVESVMKKERQAEQESWKEAMQEQMQAERDRRERAEQRARDEAAARQRLGEEKERAESKRKHCEERMNTYHERMVLAEGKYQEARKAQDELARQHAHELEIRDAFGEKGLEMWPMFPGRKVHRVLDTDDFDGRVSQEFRVKDAESGERGVTLLMGRLAYGQASECQAVLFDPTYLSDLDAARWFTTHAHRFEAARERVAREKQRASSAKGRSRDRPQLS